MDITEPAIDREPRKPEVYYFDHPTRLRVLEKQGRKPAPVKKAAKKTSKKTAKRG